MTIDLAAIEQRLTFGDQTIVRRVQAALEAIDTAKEQGGEVLYLTPTEQRVLANTGDLIFIIREVATGKLASSTILATARDVMAKLGNRTWRCPKCGQVEIISAVYDAKICLNCNERMEIVRDVAASSPPTPAASSPPTAASVRPHPEPCGCYSCREADKEESNAKGAAVHAAFEEYQRLTQTMQKLRDLSQAMLGVLDCKNPDGTARGEALAAWIELRETLDVLWLDTTDRAMAERALDAGDLDSLLRRLNR